MLGYQGRVDTTWGIAFERLRIHNPAAVRLLELAAFLGPEPIPLSLFAGHPEILDHPPPAAINPDPDAVQDAVGAAVRFSLVRRHPDSFQVHRLVQAVIRIDFPPTTGPPSRTR